MEVPVDPSCKAVLVGDVHGQFHDVLHLLEVAGLPSANRLFVFNGDYVDRGAWGFETYFYLLAWKVSFRNWLNPLFGLIFTAIFEAFFIC